MIDLLKRFAVTVTETFTFITTQVNIMLTFIVKSTATDVKSVCENLFFFPEMRFLEKV